MDSSVAATARYTTGAIAFHWIIAALIVLNFALAWSAEGAPKAQAGQLMATHKAIGISILTLTVLRIVWRMIHPAPPLAETLKAWEAALAKVVHALFYFLMVALPLSGWAMSSAADRPVSYFGLLQIPMLPIGPDRETAGMFSEMHGVFATSMLVLFVLHVTAALKHQFVDRDTTMRRILPFLRA